MDRRPFERLGEEAEALAADLRNLGLSEEAARVERLAGIIADATIDEVLRALVRDSDLAEVVCVLDTSIAREAGRSVTLGASRHSEAVN